MNENLLKYLLKYQNEELKPQKEEKNEEEKQHYGFIYSKMMEHKYASVAVKNTR